MLLQIAGFAGPHEGVHDLLHILCARAGTHEEGVLGVDDDHVLESDRGYQPLITEDQAAMCVDQHGLTVDRVAEGVWMHSIAELCPVADVGPVEIARHEQKPIGLRSEEHTSELQSHLNLVCRLLLEKKKIQTQRVSHLNPWNTNLTSRSPPSCTTP